MFLLGHTVVPGSGLEARDVLEQKLREQPNSDFYLGKRGLRYFYQWELPVQNSGYGY